MLQTTGGHPANGELTDFAGHGGSNVSAVCWLLVTIAVPISEGSRQTL